MKKAITIAVIAIMALSMVVLTACESELATECSSEKSMTVEAKNATDDNFSSVGTLVVEEGQQLVITPALDKGEIKFGFVAVPEEQSIDELPDMDAKPDYEVTVSGEEVQTVEAAPGSYQIMVTPVQTATGTVQIDVKGK